MFAFTETSKAHGTNFNEYEDLTGNINKLLQLSKKTRSDHAHIFRMCSDIMELIQDIPVPVICEVGALATAAGCQLVASCDVAIASDQAKFCTPGYVFFGHSNRFWGWGGEDNDMETRYYMMSVKTAAGVSFIPEITLESAIVTNMAQLGRNLVSVAT